MSNWWKRLLGLDSEDDYLDNGSPDEHPRAVTRGRIEVSRKNVEVKMFRKYPDDVLQQMERNHQNKALLGKDPYDEPAYVRLRSVNQKISGRKTSYQEHSLQAQASETGINEQLENKNRTYSKKRFKPTEIPSPIYGFRKRSESPQQRSQWDTTVGSDDQSGAPLLEKVTDVSKKHGQRTNVAQDGIRNQMELQEEVFELPTFEKKIEEAPEQLIDTEDAKAGTFELDEPNFVLSQESEDTVNSRDQEAVLAIEAEAVVNATPGDQFEAVPLKEVEDREASQQQEQLATEKRDDGRTRNARYGEKGRNSSIPFNVLMLGADRVNMRKKEHVGFGAGSRDEVANQQVHMSTQQPGYLTLDLLNDPPESSGDDSQWIYEKQKILEETLLNFHVKAEIVSHVQGPAVTRFELKLHPGVKINKIINLTEDIKLSMAAKQIRIATVPGKSMVGIEIPNSGRKPVFLKQLLQSEQYLHSHSPLAATLGMDVSGNQIVTDLAKMPHGLIAGTTGSGKSVCIHSLLLSLIYKTSPEDLRLILIDPKVVELAAYQQLPHLAAPLITQPKEAALALKWAVSEMEERYQLFAKKGVRDIQRYNQAKQDTTAEKMPYIIIVIDELADLMMASPQDVEEAICRIAQKARAAGIHMLLATQRPSVDVITGLIKSNIPTRIAFSVSSQADSRTILDVGGAERLLGQGDMLFVENGARDMKRLQGAFVTDEEIDRVTEALKRIEPMPFLFDIEQIQEQRMDFEPGEDALFEEAVLFVIEQNQASVSSLQRRFRIGYNRAARLVDQLEASAIISEANGSKPRQVLVDKDTYAELQ